VSRLPRLAAGIIVAIVVALFLAALARAAAPAIIVESADAIVGGRAAVALKSSDMAEPGMGAWTIDIVYDSDIVRAISCAPTQKALTVCNPEYDAHTVRVTGATIDVLTCCY
jgi:hypothetical protein